MLFDIPSEKPITRLPHAREFLAWTSRLTQTQFDAILDELDRKIDTGEIHTAGWMPGKVWTGTPFQAIYEDACNEQDNLAGMCFGQFVFLAMMDRSEAWACGRYEKDGLPIQSLTYFRIDQLDGKVPSGHGRGKSGYRWSPKK